MPALWNICDHVIFRKCSVKFEENMISWEKDVILAKMENTIKKIGFLMGFSGFWLICV